MSLIIDSVSQFRSLWLFSLFGIFCEKRTSLRWWLPYYFYYWLQHWTRCQKKTEPKKVLKFFTFLFFCFVPFLNMRILMQEITIWINDSIYKIFLTVLSLQNNCLKVFLLLHYSEFYSNTLHLFSALSYKCKPWLCFYFNTFIKGALYL